MASISAYDSSSLGVLFSSLSGSSSSSSSSSLLGGTSDLLGISYSDYATIRNGSYFKLLQAYYSGDSSDEVSTAVKSTTSTSKDDTKTLARIQSGAEDLKESAQALLETGTKSVFKEVTTTDEDGKTTTGYDTDAIYKAVSSFVSDYNTMLTQGGDSNTKSILSNTKSLVTNTAANKSMLADIGITIGSDNKLSIDEETFKKADMSKVKNLFNDRGSYGYQTATRASLIESYAKSEASKSNTYSSSGSYTYNYSTGEIYSSYM